MIILFVDDQAEVRRGIRSGIKWDKLPEVNHVLEADSVKNARELFLREPVDLLVSDIEMPEEDGLSLVTWVKEHFPQTKCIILTAHADFNYARDAVKLGCVDYLMQPVSYEELQAAIEKALYQILSERKDLVVLRKNSYYQSNAREIMQRSWHLFLQEKLDETALDDALLLSETALSKNGCFILILFDVVQSSVSLERLVNDTSLEHIKNLFYRFFAPVAFYQCQIDLSDHQYLQLIQSTAPADEVSVMIQSCHVMCQTEYGCDLAVYLDSGVLFHHLSESYSRLVALRDNNVASYPRIFWVDDPIIESCAALPSTTLWPDYFVKGQKEVLAGQLQSFINRCIENGTMNRVTLLALQQSLLFAFQSSLKQRGIPLRSVMGREELLQTLPISTHGAQNFLNFAQVLMELAGEFSDHAKVSSGRMIEDAMEYVQTHMSDPELSRQRIASSVHISESYLSHLFQKELGFTLSEYIQKTRILMAKSLLSTTHMQIKFIAMKTGYRSESYFTKAFRKECGVTPKKYRENCMAET